MPAELPVPGSPDVLVRTVTDVVAAKFPDHDRAEVETAVRRSYQRLAADSRIPDHLAVLVQHEVVDQLQRAAG